MTDAIQFTLPADIDVQQGPIVRDDLLAMLAPGVESLALDMGDGAPGQVALQLFFATLAEAGARGIAVTLGPVAAGVAARAVETGTGGRAAA